MIGLLDCNNFYVSCERLFDRKLEGKPVIVLSNNDGCIISRSNEAKKIGIRMGEPLFKAKEKIKKFDIQVRSSNYSLYADISSRVMKIVKKVCNDIEIYSIDEVFLGLENIKNRELFCFLLKKKILQYTGIPVSIGIAKNKTLSKIANKIAKQQSFNLKNSRFNGIFEISSDKKSNEVLMNISIQDIWGVGKALSKFFNDIGVSNAYQLKNTNENLIRQEKGVVMHRTILELRGFKCFNIEKLGIKKKSICVSRSFGEKTSCYYSIKDALILYVQKASEKLRSCNLSCGCVLVFLQTSRYEKKFYAQSEKFIFDEPVIDTRIIWKKADYLLRKIYLKNYYFNKVGVILLDLRENSEIQRYLFTKNKKIDKKNYNLMNAVDLINKKFGEGAIKISSDTEGSLNNTKTNNNKLDKKWFMKSNFVSPCYTTRWCDIPKVK